MLEEIPAILPTILAVMSIGFLPFLVVMGTSFTKIVIVLMLLRTAMGVQTAPSGLVINSIALTLTAFIMAPIGNEILQSLQNNNLSMSTWDDTVEIYDTVAGTFTEYLLKFTEPGEMEFFMDAARKLWPPEMQQYVHEESLLILLPSHVTSEITKAFQIAFLLFLPFVVIDMVVSNVLLAMGAMMMPPTLISLPVKILLFISVDGWGKLLHGLVVSYA